MPVRVDLRVVHDLVTTEESVPTLQAQQDDAEAKGQVGRAKVYDRLLGRWQTEGG